MGIGHEALKMRHIKTYLKQININENAFLNSHQNPITTSLQKKKNTFLLVRQTP